MGSKPLIISELAALILQLIKISYQRRVLLQSLRAFEAIYLIPYDKITSFEQQYNHSSAVAKRTMSIYNGFVNHDQQIRYYQLIKYLVLAMEKRLIKFYKGEQANEVKFIKLINKIRHKIAKMEQRKYSQPKFADSIADLLKEVDMPFTSQFSDYNLRTAKLDRDESSMSHLSLDFSMANTTHIPKDKFTAKLPDTSELIQRRKRYKSLEKMKNQSIMEEIEYDNERKYSSKVHYQLKEIRPKGRPPKIEPYIENIRKESNDLISSGRKLRVMKELDSYIGQRRKKTKKNIRTLPFKI